jgi:hypothetical protein
MTRTCVLHGIAVQFHVEVTEETLAGWNQLPAYQAAAEAAPGTSGLRTLGRAFRRARDSMADSAERLFPGWLQRAGAAQRNDHDRQPRAAT